MKRPNTALSLVLSGLFIFALVAGFGILYFNNHAWGTWGDDSAGYIYLAGRMMRDQPLVYQDALAKSGFEFFQDEKLARWLTPTHHQFINQSGFLASKYPVGASLLLYTGARIFGSDHGFYYVTPLLAVLNIMLLYILALLLFPKHKHRHVIGVLAGFSMGIANLYYDYAIAQPMREIPSITFILLIAIFCCVAARICRSKQKFAKAGVLLSMVLAGAAFGMAFNIRETSVLMLPAIAVFAYISYRSISSSFRETVRALIAPIAVFCLFAAIAAIPTIQNSYNISKEKEVFKARDTSEVVILSNIGHVETLSLQNLFDNQGKFRPGKGSLPHYWKIMQQASPLPYFLLFVVIGIIYLWKESRARASLLVLWMLAFIGLFSLWVNPYSRYILPAFPALFLLGSYGMFAFFQQFLPLITKKKLYIGVVTSVIAISFLFGYQPLLAQAMDNIHDDVLRFKAISQQDLLQLEYLGEQVQTAEQPVVLFSGDWQYGISETFEAHTGVKTIRFPLEQRFAFSPDQVYTFFDQMRESGYDLFVWVDETSSPELFDWLEQQHKEQIDIQQYSFQPDVFIYKLSH